MADLVGLDGVAGEPADAASLAAVLRADQSLPRIGGSVPAGGDLSAAAWAAWTAVQTRDSLANDRDRLMLVWLDAALGAYAEGAQIVDEIRPASRAGIVRVIRWEWWRAVSSFPGRLRMPSVVGLPEQHELAARRPVMVGSAAHEVTDLRCSVLGRGRVQRGLRVEFLRRRAPGGHRADREHLVAARGDSSHDRAETRTSRPGVGLHTAARRGSDSG
ncbi:hypothetical protein [Streptomyces sp. NPDC005435]|uniref:hypothetical protein n=1 Tax=Streptomyces sp. NPDC005435 TaxID=3154464 RepID=UPI003452415A